MDGTKKIAVIGGGPGGYVAAIRAAQLGAKVTLIEKEKVGGTCLNVGCIPTKVLLHTAELIGKIKESEKIGIKVSGVEIDWETLQKRKSSVVSQLVGGVKGLLSANGIRLIEGTACFNSPKSIFVTKKDGSREELIADGYIIASGSIPAIPPIEGVRLSGVIDSTEALSLKKLPESMVIIGGGVIGVEFASAFKSMGCDVTIVEMLPFILPPIDGEVSTIVKSKLTKNGIKIYNEAKVTAIRQGEEKLEVSVSIKDKDIVLTSEKVLVAVGRKAYLEGLDVQKAGVKLERGCIAVNDRMNTDVDGIYAIGDCTGKNMLAHVASEQGVVAAETIMGMDVKMNYKTVPACVYTNPELASVGLTEEQARDKGIDFKVGRFPLMANGKSLIMDEAGGIIKIIADKKYGEVLGVHILGPRATDLITEGALSLRLEATIDEIITTVHAHPTIGEAFREAALAVDKRALHIPNSR